MASIFGVLTNASILLQTWVYGQKVGTDEQGNRYYRGRARKGTQRERRWVIYRGAPEASTVPPEWHGWLHHQTSLLPADNNPYRKKWQKAHKPNMTGTVGAYLPPGKKFGIRPPATGDYTPWQPPLETKEGKNQ